MPRTELTAVIPDEDGIVESPVAANVDGFYLKPNSGRMVLEVINGGGAPIDVTLQTTYTSGVNTLSDNVVSVTNGDRVKINIPASVLSNYLATNPDTSQARSVVLVDFSAVTSVTCVLSHI